MEAATAIVAIIAAVILVAGLAQRFGFRLPRVAARPVQLDAFPRVAVILPIKGVDDDTHINIHALLDQDYPDYRLIFTVESEQDPVLAPLEKLATEDSRIEIVVAGVATHRGQKVHNQLAAVERTTAHDEVLAFMDADAKPNPGWLRALVAPLTREEIGATTGLGPRVRDIVARLVDLGAVHRVPGLGPARVETVAPLTPPPPPSSFTSSTLRRDSCLACWASATVLA